MSAPEVWRNTMELVLRRVQPWQVTTSAKCSWKRRGVSRSPYRAFKTTHRHVLSCCRSVIGSRRYTRRSAGRLACRNAVLTSPKNAVLQPPLLFLCAR
eukprot:3700240-Heterocapsa_arctica.AAC.1